MKDGLVVISVTDEKQELVDQYMREMKVTHPVAILPDGALEKVIGVSGFPTSAVFVGGEMQWKGHPSSAKSAIAAAMKQATKGGPYPDKLSKAFKKMAAGDAVAAYAEVEKVKPKLDEKDAAWAARYQSYLQEEASKAFARAEAAISAGFWYQAEQEAAPYLGKKGSPFTGAPEAEAKLAALTSEEAYKKEMAGGKLYAEAQALAGAKEYLEAAKTYRSAYKKAKGTQIGQHAYDAAMDLIQARKPGYKATCPKCDHKNEVACAKHLEEVKL